MTAFLPNTLLIKRARVYRSAFSFYSIYRTAGGAFDALEDAAFKHVNDLNGAGTLKHLQSEVQQTQKQEELSEKLNDFAVRLVLTAHPTQFYPGEVLGIINDLSKALADENAALINMYLQQLGKTPF